MTDRAYRARLQAAAVEGRAVLSKLRDLLADTDAALAIERRQLADAVRRGELATGIGDAETAQVAADFVTRHGERVAMLEQKRLTQLSEIGLLQRDVDDLVQRLKDAGLGVRDVPDADDMPEDPDREAARLVAEVDQVQREADADAALRELKRRMGR